MGCFFGCFRIKDSNANLVTPTKEPVAAHSKNALSSLFLNDDESLGKGEEGQNQLEDEAEFLKVCRTLPRTPIKIENALEKWEGISAPNETDKSSKLDARLQNAPIEKLKLETQYDESPLPVKNCEVWVTGSGSFLDSPSSCITDGHYTQRASSSSTKRRDVQIVDTSMVMCDSETRSEISSVSTEVNPSHRNELKDESSNSKLPSESVKLNDEDNLIPTPVSDLSVRKEEMEIEEGLSSWFKPISAKQDDDNKRFSSISSENVHRRKISVDRPILGMVAAHWNEDNETSHISPKCKWWDGNGIPNSTNKYKEDQKVSWHATPFEERLEKALSEETFLSQKKPINRTPPFELSETEESDTALSHMRSSANLKSVVSF